ncbi:MAG: hypothetical protein WC374_10255 [Phycisphaerae bacterium]|jgi:hypothetical protein
MDINYDYLLEIDITPSTTATYKELMDGIENLDQAINEVIVQTAYLKNKGWGSSEVTGGQYIVTLTGNRIVGDEAQDYIFSSDVMYAFGAARKTNLRLTEPGGRQITIPVTLAKVNLAGGDANQPSKITIEIHGNGEPTLAEDGEVIGQLTVVSVEGVEAGKTQLYVNPALTEDPVCTYKYKTAAQVSVPAYGTTCTTGWTAWDGEAEITATTGNEIVVIEVNASNEALKAGKQTVTSNDAE